MSSDIAERVARAVLYEGYVLYPYRRSSIRNRQRWNFGVLYPEAWASGSDRSWFQMQVPLVCGEAATVEVTLRFLHLLMREGWQEGVERTASSGALEIKELLAAPYGKHLRFEPDVDNARMEPLNADLEISASGAASLAGCPPSANESVLLTVIVRNNTTLDSSDREEALLRSLASAHAVAHATNADFISVTDPPDNVRDDAAQCCNLGVWPVLVGAECTRDTILASPIILSDYPQVAPESAGDLFDATEIDEILTLRVLTLTDAEKDEVRASGDHARRLLERAESLSQEQLLSLHGTIREWRAGLRRGDRVRLKLSRRADPFDMLLDGKIAIVEAVEQDFEDRVHVAVVMEDDPGRDLGEMRQPGHRFFFSLDEVEPVA